MKICTEKWKRTGSKCVRCTVKRKAKERWWPRKTDWRRPVCDVDAGPGQCCSLKSWAGGRCDGGSPPGRFCPADSPGPTPAGGNQDCEVLLHQELSLLEPWKHLKLKVCIDTHGRPHRVQLVLSKKELFAQTPYAHRQVTWKTSSRHLSCFRRDGGCDESRFLECRTSAWCVWNADLGTTWSQDAREGKKLVEAVWCFLQRSTGKPWGCYLDYKKQLQAMFTLSFPWWLAFWSNIMPPATKPGWVRNRLKSTRISLRVHSSAVQGCFWQ